MYPCTIVQALCAKAELIVISVRKQSSYLVVELLKAWKFNPYLNRSPHFNGIPKLK